MIASKTLILIRTTFSYAPYVLYQFPSLLVLVHIILFAKCSGQFSCEEGKKA